MGNLCLRKKEKSQQNQYNLSDENHITYTPATLDELDKKIKIESQGMFNYHILDDNSSEALISNMDSKQDQFEQGQNQTSIQIYNHFDKDAETLQKQGELAKAELQKMKKQQNDSAGFQYDQQLKQNLFSKQDDSEDSRLCKQEERIQIKEGDETHVNKYEQEQEAENMRLQQIEEERIRQEQLAEKLRLEQIEQETIKQEQVAEDSGQGYFDEETVEQNLDFNQLQHQTENINFKFVWTSGGNKIFLTGSWLNWTDQLELIQIDDRFEIELELPKGIHEFKFIVDDEWKVSDQYEYNGQNNQINV
ncbi:unnamed protein product [Paramecium sonneborni]|uniref:AMP-activated protein kinase glycogen-binding domain-containing protein n=1 Tax=Paramecium sonneborni TaxID=65129 RepID=A0A8S1MQT6_9CILI|nr:unnamed protein product [Paramecium sonneborni]